MEKKGEFKCRGELTKLEVGLPDLPNYKMEHTFNMNFR